MMISRVRWSSDLRILPVAAAIGLASTACVSSCFRAGTRVRTPRGPRRIEELGLGDVVVGPGVGFRVVGDLAPDTALLDWSGAGDLRVGSVVAIEDVRARDRVFNLHVSGPSTYFADDRLVHNESPLDYCGCDSNPWQMHLHQSRRRRRDVRSRLRRDQTNRRCVHARTDPGPARVVL